MDILKKDGPRTVHGIDTTITLEFEDERMARSIYESVNVDNYQFISCRLDGKKVICRVQGNKPATVQHTIDDFLACVLTAESAYHSI